MLKSHYTLGRNAATCLSKCWGYCIPFHLVTACMSLGTTTFYISSLDDSKPQGKGGGSQNCQWNRLKQLFSVLCSLLGLVHVSFSLSSGCNHPHLSIGSFSTTSILLLPNIQIPLASKAPIHLGKGNSWCYQEQWVHKGHTDKTYNRASWS